MSYSGPIDPPVMAHISRGGNLVAVTVTHLMLRGSGAIFNRVRFADGHEEEVMNAALVFLGDWEATIRDLKTGTTKAVVVQAEDRFAARTAVRRLSPSGKIVKMRELSADEAARARASNDNE